MANEENFMPGGWSTFTPPTNDEIVAFREATVGNTSLEYTPLLVTSQRGGKYIFAANSRAAASFVTPAYAALVRVFKTRGETAIPCGIVKLGGRKLPNSYGPFETASQEARAALSSAQGAVVDFHTNCVAVQRLDGINYLFVGTVLPSSPKDEAYPAVVIVNKSPEGETTITAVRDAYNYG